MHSRDFDRVAEAERIELIALRVHAAGLVALVDRQHHRLFRPLQHRRDLRVRRSQADRHIDDHHDDRRRLNGDLRLPAHEFQHFAARTRLDAAGVDEQEAPPVPLAVAVDAVARDARRILHNGHPPPGQFVEQQRFAHIRPPHNGDNGFCHIITSFLRRSQYSADPRNFAPRLVGADDSVRPPRRSGCLPPGEGFRATNGRPYVHRRNCESIRRDGHCPPAGPTRASAPTSASKFDRSGRTGSSAPTNSILSFRGAEKKRERLYSLPLILVSSEITLLQQK